MNLKNPLSNYVEANLRDHRNNNHTNQHLNINDIAIYVGLALAVTLVVLLILYCFGCFNKCGNQRFVRIVEDVRPRQLTHKELLAQLNGASPMLDKIANRRMKEQAAYGSSYGAI